jgi:hypothetical protein
MKKLANKNILFVLLFIVVLSSKAQIAANQGFVFLKLPTDAITNALGGVSVSHHTATADVFWNNAALLDTSQSQRFSITYSPYLAATQALTTSFAFRSQHKNHWAAGVQYLNYGTIPQTDAAGNDLGTFTAADYAIAGAYARTENNYTLGITTKLAGTGIENYQNIALTTDFTGVFRAAKQDFTWGIAVKNIGFVFKKFGISSPELPFDLQIGTTFKPRFMPVRVSLTAHHLYRWDIVYNDPATNFKYDNNGNKVLRVVSIPEKIMRHLTFGLELLVHPQVSVLAGYNHLRRQELRLPLRSGGAGLSAGIAIRTTHFTFSYGYARYHWAGGGHALTMSYWR